MGGTFRTILTAMQQSKRMGGFGNAFQALQGQQPQRSSTDQPYMKTNQSPVTHLPQVIDDTQGQPFLPQNQPSAELLNMLAAQLMGRNRQNGQYSQMRNRFFNNDRW